MYVQKVHLLQFLGNYRNFFPENNEYILEFKTGLIFPRVIYDRVRNRKNYFEIAAFLNFQMRNFKSGEVK